MSEKSLLFKLVTQQDIENFRFLFALHRGFRGQVWKDFGTELEPAIDWTMGKKLDKD